LFIDSLFLTIYFFKEIEYFPAVAGLINGVPDMIKKVVSSDRKIRIAIVGCGRISKSHFESIEARADELELQFYYFEGYD
jgi:hypothetical protein